MWKIIWAKKPRSDYYSTLEYWINHNKSITYSEKIISAVEEVEKKISDNPFFLTRYHKNINLYQKLFFNQKFSIFYQVNDVEKTIFIIHFRSNKQRPLI